MAGYLVVFADKFAIQTVVRNLINNAIKFTPQAGNVLLSIINETDELISVSIIDSGIGIPQDRLGEVFESFHQLDGSSTRRYGGTGLGLSLVKNILDAHGSPIEVKSVEGKGTEFKFHLLTVESTKE